jgi:hypothetical protein
MREVFGVWKRAAEYGYGKALEASVWNTDTEEEILRGLGARCSSTEEVMSQLFENVKS